MATDSDLFSHHMAQDSINTWHQADLHIHSPVSPDFNISPEVADPFLELLQQAHDNQIEIICITDHNDIHGYFKLKDLENEIKSVKDGLQKRQIPIPSQINQQSELFDKVIYLPGVELDVYPNIHLVIIFDPNDTEDAINDFIIRAGYPPNIRGDETSARYAKWTFAEALDEADSVGAITIAAHIDSDKGIYEESKSWGQARIDAFTHKSLWAMEFLKTTSRDQIINMLRYDPNYLRNSPLAFIQSSDFHGKTDQKIGDRRTFIRIDNLLQNDKKKVFDAIKIALRNPDEYISAPESPDVGLILKKLMTAPFVVDINSDDNLQLISRYICAYANSEDGTIVIGRNIKGNWEGIKIDDPDAFTNDVIGLLENSVVPNTVVAIRLYKYSPKKYICTIRVQKQAKIHTLKQDDKVYVLESGKPKAISTQEIINLAEFFLAKRYSGLSISGRISDISIKLNGLQDTIDILSIVKKIEAKTIKINNVFKAPKLGGVINEELQDHINYFANGCPDGNLILTPKIVPPRYDDHYLRLSAPIGLCDEMTYKFDDQFRFSGQKIIISLGGAVYYDQHDNINIYGNLWEPLIFAEQENGYLINLLYITIYLKSAIAIWYAIRCLGSVDLRSVSILKKVLIPHESSSQFSQEIISSAKELLHIERDYLERETMLAENLNAAKIQQENLDSWNKNLSDGIENHNQQADQIMAKIDNLFFKEFNLDESEIEIIYKILKSNNLARFYENTN